MEELITSAPDYSSFYKVFNDLVEKDLGKFINPKLFKTDDIFVYIGLKNDANYYKNLFKQLNDAQISFVPKYIGSAKSDSGFSASFAQIADTENADLKDFNKFYNCLSQGEKQNAYAGVQKLLKLGLMNSKIVTREAFAITPNENKIVVPDWEAVFFAATPECKADYLKIARETLFRQG